MEEDSSIYTYKVSYVDLRNGGEQYNNYYREIEPCRLENYKKFPETFDKLVLNKTHCLKNLSTYLKGYWDDQQSYYMSVKLEKCTNSTESKIVCKSEEEISEYLNNKYFNIFYQQNNFDLSNFNQPITSKIKTFFSGLEKGRKKEAKLFLKKTILYSDYQVIFAKEDTIDSYSFDRIESDTTGSENILFEIQIYSSDIKTVLKRRYEKLFEVIAVLGGITNSLTVIFAVLIKILYDWNINELIMNSLFVIRDCKIDNKKTKITKISAQRKKLFEDLKLTLWDKILMFLKRKKKRTQKEKLYLDYIHKSDAKLDLIHVLKKIEEIDRLKLILLNKEQIQVFDSMSKKYVFVRDASMKLQTNKFLLDSMNFDIENKMSAKHFIQNIKQDSNSNEIDKRLINLIE